MKVHFDPNQHYIYNNFTVQKNNNRDIAFKSFVYNPKSIINQQNPVAKHLFKIFDKAVLTSRITWIDIQPSLKNYIKEFDVKKNDENVVRLWDINKDERKKYVVIMHGFCHNISCLQELYENILNKTNYGILAQEYSGLRKCDRGHVNMSPKNFLEDSEIGFKYLTEKGINPKDIIILGHSFGGFVASQLASKEKDASGLIMVSAIDSLEPIANNIKNGRNTYVPENISKMIKNFKIYTWYMSKMYKTSKYLKKVKAPVDIIHSEQDRYVVMDSANKLIKSCKNLSSVNILQEGFHKMDNDKINAIVTLLNQKSSC